MKKFLALLAALPVACLTFAACNSGAKDGGDEWSYPSDSEYLYFTDGSAEDGYVYDSIEEVGFENVSERNTSYFSLDRNTATYSLIRSEIEDGSEIYPDSVRIEEMINYFDYDFAAPEDKSVAVSTALSSCPWNDEHKLMLVGLKTKEFVMENANANYVFLIDVSGSMSGDSRLGLAKKGLNILLDGLGENDVVSIVTYANGVKTVIEGCECTESGKEQLRNAISSLRASGATNGGEGLERAYKIAKERFITGGNNRVIIISDGDFNVGISDQTELKEFIQEKAETGIYLSVLGVGMGNLRDDFLQTLATCGNGNYAYLDSETEAEKVFGKELKGNLYTVAKDAKAGVTFTENVEKYRLIGYDAKRLSEEDFNDIAADAGEIGSNLCVAALYEIELSDSAEGKLADVEVKYKDVLSGTEKSESVTATVNSDSAASDDLAFISCVAEFGLILRNSEYKGTASISSVLARLESLTEYMQDDVYKEEFVTLVTKASESEYYK